jgi:hypothetical protein
MLGDLLGRKPTVGLFFAGSVVVALAPFLIHDALVLFMATPFAAPETRATTPTLVGLLGNNYMRPSMLCRSTRHASVNSCHGSVGPQSSLNS